MNKGAEEGSAWTFRPPSYPTGHVSRWVMVVAIASTLMLRRRSPVVMLAALGVAAWPQIEKRIAPYMPYAHELHAFQRQFAPVWRFGHRALGIKRMPRLATVVPDEDTKEWQGFPDLLTFKQAYGIGQSQSTSFGTLILLSLESYIEGCLLSLRLLLDTDPEESPEEAVILEPKLTANDDSGTTYQILPYGGTGRGRRWRWEFRTTEPLHAQARELRLEVLEIRWQKHGPRYPFPITERVEKGHWTFVVPL